MGAMKNFPDATVVPAKLSNGSIVLGGQIESNDNGEELALGKIDAINRLTVSEARKEPPIIIVWRNVFIFIYLHLAAFYGLYLCFTDAVTWATLVWCKRMNMLAVIE